MAPCCIQGHYIVGFLLLSHVPALRSEGIELLKSQHLSYGTLFFHSYRTNFHTLIFRLFIFIQTEIPSVTPPLDHGPDQKLSCLRRHQTEPYYVFGPSVTAGCHQNHTPECRGKWAARWHGERRRSSSSITLLRVNTLYSQSGWGRGQVSNASWRYRNCSSRTWRWTRLFKNFYLGQLKDKWTFYGNGEDSVFCSRFCSSSSSPASTENTSKRLLNALM